ncbi:uncharacterized protein LOC117563946 [Drosophila albomicans]|uniref:Uncharacterized protein LOC117563946 n=1 Tax=Drosophila albomicans TaxID=7291 RepID=A0A6P8WGJ9_DROAB|nr:uncharacterized protein LOC117563946 [Drosophila albomicans]
MFHYNFVEQKMSMLSTNVRSAYECEEDFSGFKDDKEVPQELSQTCLLILDYKQFLAARCIQRAWRRFYASRPNRKDWAAIKIQRWWRGYATRKNYLKLVENMLHERLWAHYNKSATKIQALYRGWLVRQTVHDAYSLRHTQQLAAEELLCCVAYRLHHLLRTQAIPGVYSLRNSSCLSKVEKLLTSTTFRFHNDRARYYQMHMANLMKNRREEFKRNKFRTAVPFKGPNFNTGCNLACEESAFGIKYLDARMYKIIKEYETGKIDEKIKKVHRTLADRKYRKHVEDMISRTVNTSHNFCGDVIESMRKWRIWDDNNLKISEHIFRTPEMLNSFLDEAAILIDELNNVPCYCRIDNFEEVTC